MTHLRTPLRATPLPKPRRNPFGRPKVRTTRHKHHRHRSTHNHNSRSHLAPTVPRNPCSQQRPPVLSKAGECPQPPPNHSTPPPRQANDQSTTPAQPPQDTTAARLRPTMKAPPADTQQRTPAGQQPKHSPSANPGNPTAGRSVLTGPAPPQLAAHPQEQTTTQPLARTPHPSSGATGAPTTAPRRPRQNQSEWQSSDEHQPPEPDTTTMFQHHMPMP